MTERITYKDAGVDVELADRVIGSLSERIRSTFGPGVIGSRGGFAALVRPDWSKYQDPVLVSATDGVGTKLKIAFLTGKHDTVGIDLVAMNVNDILVTGAEPLFFLDYFATGALDAAVATTVISGIAHGCEVARCSLVGGETAEMPDFYASGEYDLAGFCVGLVDRSGIMDGTAMKPGHIVLGLGSTGLHSNGYSLVRRVLLDKKGYSLDQFIPDLGKTLAEELLTPTRIYVRPVLDVLDAVPVSAMAHITGGGFTGNIPRVVPSGCRVVIKKGSWTVRPIFDIIRKEAALDDRDMFATFNMGIGMVMTIAPEHAQKAADILYQHDVPTWFIGDVVEAN